MLDNAKKLFSEFSPGEHCMVIRGISPLGGFSNPRIAVTTGVPNIRIGGSFEISLQALELMVKWIKEVHEKTPTEIVIQIQAYPGKTQS